MRNFTIPLKDIIVKDRLREDLGDIEGLAASIARFGLIQPIVLNQSQQLVAGGRRYAACQKLALEHVSVCYVETLSQDELHELELEENIRRKSMTWQEECLSILEIHRLKKRRGALEGWRWSQRLAAEAFGMELGTINYVLRVAERLKLEQALPSDKRRFWNFQSAAEAYRLGLLKDEQDRLQAELAKRHRENANKNVEETHAKQLIDFVQQVEAEPDALAEQRERYNSNPLNTVPFEEYWANKQAEAKQLSEVIYVSNRVIHMNSIDFMLMPEQRSRFDHIITDIPYGIDIEMLNQQNPHGGLADLDTIADEHDVDENLELIKSFYPAAWLCTKDNAFVITFADLMNWQLMYNIATEVGFAVQRWPFVWLKPHAMNQCAQYNFTKNYEIAIIARKPGATLANKVNRSDFLADNAQAVMDTGHKFAKPYEVTELLTNAVSIQGQTILEPFAGRGSMVIQMLRMHRNVIAVEKQETHYNYLLENIKKMYLKINPNFKFQ